MKYIFNFHVCDLFAAHSTSMQLVFIWKLKFPVQADEKYVEIRNYATNY